LFFPEVHAPHALSGTILHTQGLHDIFLVLFFLHLFYIFLSVYFLETLLGTWNRISPLCNVFGELLNNYPLSSQILMRCFDFLIWMILEWIMSKTLKNCLVSGKLELHDSKWKYYKMSPKPRAIVLKLL